MDQEVMDMRNASESRGEVIVFTGSGKGKTKAALGTALRMIAAGGKVVFICFTGPLHPELGEVRTAATFGNSFRMIGIKSEAKDVSYLNSFSDSVDTVEDALTMAHKVWVRECDLVVLDGINPQLDRGRLNIAQVMALIEDRPPNTSIILTGQSAPEIIMKRADLVTEFVQTKQPPQTSMPRKGIDF